MKINEKKKALRRIYVRRHRGGRRALAYWLDFTFTAVIVLLALYLCVRPHFRNRVAAEALTVVCGALALCIYRIVDGELLRRSVKKLREETRREISMSRLLLDPDGLFDRITCEKGVFTVKSLEAVTSDDVKAALGTGGDAITIVTFAKPTEAAMRLIECSRAEVSFIAPHDYLGLDPEKLFPAGEEDIDAAIIKKYGSLLKKPHITKAVFALTRERAIKYLAVGAGLMLFSLFARYAVYYRILASLSLSVGAYVFAAEELKKRALKRPEA